MINRRSVEPNVTFINLIDVTMVLLIIFMMAAPTIQQWVDVKLPTAEVSKAKITEGIVVSITKDGNVYIDREKIKFSKFRDEFAKVWEKRSGEPIFIRADGEVPYKNVIEVIGVAKQLGGENGVSVGLVVEEPKKSAK